MSRKIRSDATIKSVSKKYGLSENAFRHSNGRKMRNDKTIGSIRKETGRKEKK